MVNQPPKNEHSSSTGTLYVVATPIGNLEDLSPRAARILKEVGIVLAEDTRNTVKLLKTIESHARMISYHDHNERNRAAELLAQIKSGISMALVSDAGTPTISDPGYRIIKACQESGVPVVTVPGPSAVIAALSISGFPTDRFMFEGFLAPKGNKRINKLKEILENPWTTILFESTHKIQRLLTEMVELDPNRELVIARELTKIYEEVLRGNVSELLKISSRSGGLKGEMVVIIKGKVE